MICVQAAITSNRVDCVAGTDELKEVITIDPENVATDRIIFELRVRSEMYTQKDNMFDNYSLATIKLQNDVYGLRTPTDRMTEDGSMKLKLILEDIQAVKVVCADVYRQKIQNACLKKYGYNIKKATEDSTRCSKEIVRVDGSYDSS